MDYPAGGRPVWGWGRGGTQIWCDNGEAWLRPAVQLGLVRLCPAMGPRARPT